MPRILPSGSVANSFVDHLATSDTSFAEKLTVAIPLNMFSVLCSQRWFDVCLDELPARRVGNHKHEAHAAAATVALDPAPWREADRIIALIVTQLPAQRPDAFELSREWSYVVDEDGRVRMRVTASIALSIAEQLAGWGSAVEVLEPENVKAHLARLGAELVNLYAPASSQIPTAGGQCPR